MGPRAAQLLEEAGGKLPFCGRKRASNQAKQKKNKQESQNMEKLWQPGGGFVFGFFLGVFGGKFLVVSSDF